MSELSTHLLDIDGVSEQHGQAVQAHAPACCGRKAILQAANKALIHMHGLIISLGLVLHQHGDLGLVASHVCLLAVGQLGPPDKITEVAFSTTNKQGQTAAAPSVHISAPLPG